MSSRQLAPLTNAQRGFADARADMVMAVAAALVPAAGDGFVSIRDTRSAARGAGVASTEGRSERDMIHAAGFGRLKTAGLLGEWESLVNAAFEAARFHHDDIDLHLVSRQSLAWCLADRPADHAIATLCTLSRDIVTDDVHDERLRPSYRRLLDGWHALGA